MKNTITLYKMYVVDFIPLAFALVLIAYFSWVGTVLLGGDGVFFARVFLGGFLVTFGILKFLGMDDFVQTFRRYDLIAMRVPLYAVIYPYIEMALGIGFLTGYMLVVVSVIALVLGVVTALSATIAIVGGQKYACACMGYLFDIPLTRFTVLQGLLLFVFSMYILQAFLR